MTVRWLYPSLLAILATGCSMAPRYTTPVPPVPQAFPERPAEQGPDVTELRWQDFYADPHLRQVLELAVNHNRDLRIAVLNTEKARAYYRIQRSALLPTVNLTGMELRERLPASVSGLGQPTVPSEFGVTAGITAWEIDFFGRIQSLKQQALEQFLGTEQAQRTALLSLRAEVANAYLTLAGDQETLQMAKDTLDSQRTTHKLVQRRLDVGSGSAIDVRRAQISLDSAQVDVANYTRLVALDRSNLDLLVGAPVPAELLPDKLSQAPLRQDFTLGLPALALTRRPDVLMAENQLKAANANIGAARAAFFPNISLTTNFGTMDSQLSGPFKSGSRSWTFSPQINLPIFDYGARRAHLKVSKADRDIYLAPYTKAIQVAIKEVSDALVQRDTLRDQGVAQQALTEATAATYQLVKARYDVGIDGSLSMLDAQRSLWTAQQALIAIRRTELSNLVTLYKVLGGGSGVAEPAPWAPTGKP